MDKTDGKGSVRRARVYRSVAEKRRLVELTLLPGASVSLVAQAEGVNSHQIFDWRRAYRNGKLGQQEKRSCALLPVIMSAPEVDAEVGGAMVEAVDRADGDREPKITESTASAPAVTAGAIHIELPGRAAISVEGIVDAQLLRTVLEMLRP